MKKNDFVIVIGGGEIINSMDREFTIDLSMWGDQCAAIKAGFKQKTSRMQKGEKTYEYTKWYRIKGDGGLECIGDREPDYRQYFPPEPKQKYDFKVRHYEGGHILIDSKDYEGNRSLFKDCLAFRLEDCQNYLHPLYKNPEKAIDSVPNRGASSKRSLSKPGQKKEDICLNDYDCDVCKYSDDCPEGHESR